MQREEFDRGLLQRGIVPVHLTRDQVQRDGHGFANRVLWPTFHYLLERLPIDAGGWDAYREINEAFADVVVREYRTNDTIWVHDYHLMLLPALLRGRLPRARIGFFLHIPFPSFEVFRILPWRREILEGLLGADVVGFHTYAYMRHFMSALLHMDRMEANVNRVRAADGREVRLGVFPLGVDARAFSDLATRPDVMARAEAIRRDAGGRRIVLGIDRLDYTKGIPCRIEAVAGLLEREPALRDGMRYIQVAIPSRGEVDSYQQFRRDVEERVGHVNGSYGTLRSLPVHYVHQSVSAHELSALYCAADVMLVTPLRDGMNLVSKEFVASREHEDGVLVLSEFAGAAAELHGALMVNPYDPQAVADGICRALAMPIEEQRARMRALRRRVREHDVEAWAGSFLEQLRAVRPVESVATTRPRPSLPAVLGVMPRTTKLRLLLDYDGTLVPLARSPELAVPDSELLTLLAQLAVSPGIQVDLVSGRSLQTLQRWFGKLPLSLWAEHGLWHRARPRDAWTRTVTVPLDWIDRVRPLLEQFVSCTPGSRIETKSASLAWHYREAPRELGASQARELRLLLGHALSRQPFEVLEGKKLIEVRCRGVSKSLVAQRVGADAGAETVIIAIGDDRTDEELFRALPANSLSVAVGKQWTAASFRLEDHRAVRQLLRSLLARDAQLDERSATAAVSA